VRQEHNHGRVDRRDEMMAFLSHQSHAMNELRRFLIVAVTVALVSCASSDDRTAADIRAVLAPTGSLRVGVNVGSPTQMVRTSPQAEPRGVSHDLGKELARRLRVPLEIVEFRNGNDVLMAMKAGKIDFMGTNATAVRAADVDFTATAIEIEVGYLVPAGSALQSVDDVKRAGLRVGVTQGSTSQTTLPLLLPQAVVVAAPNIAAGAQMIRERSVDAYSTQKAILFELSDGVPGSRVLAGSIGMERWALAVPKGRQAAMPYLNSFLQEVRQNGDLAKAVERSGLRGARLP
jgi:polar amino acid transport system substrate-binding protein